MNFGRIQALYNLYKKRRVYSSPTYRYLLFHSLHNISQYYTVFL